MAMYATPTELAGRLQKDLDTYSATQALTLASGEFSAASQTWFAATAATYTTTGGSTWIYLPHSPVTAVSSVTVNGSTITGWTLVNGVVYRSAGFGSASSYPPDLVVVSYTHGNTTVPDDVKRAVLDLAGEEYERAGIRSVQTEAIGDYRITYFNGGVIGPGEPWDVVVNRYRIPAVA